MKKLFVSAMIFLIATSAIFASDDYFEWKTLPSYTDFGSFEISVMVDGKWVHAGSLPFDQYPETKSIDLSTYTDGNAIKVLVSKDGGGHAHIDALTLGDHYPASVYGMDELTLKKLSGNDNDVVDVSEKELMIEFLTSEKSELTITGRIEATEISKKPFVFPRGNDYRHIHLGSEFLSYKLGSSSAEPFLKKYVYTGSGHPSSYIYAWVDNDDKNLYVKIEFTPDNTLDGQTDYAKIYLRHDSEVKEYVLRAGGADYGTSSFTYTNKVNYQHKIYNFSIPLEMETSSNVKVDLCFELYGTAVSPIPDAYLDLIYEITQTTAKGDARIGNVNPQINILSYGLIWGTQGGTDNPKFSGEYEGFTSNTDLGNQRFNRNEILYTDIMSELDPGTQYYVRAYVEWETANQPTDRSEFEYSSVSSGSNLPTSFRTEFYGGVPLRNWGLMIGIGLIVLFSVLFIRRRTG
jgi:hypothetical protein